jgi:hypothetical protein
MEFCGYKNWGILNPRSLAPDPRDTPHPSQPRVPPHPRPALNAASVNVKKFKNMNVYLLYAALEFLTTSIYNGSRSSITTTAPYK